MIIARDGKVTYLRAHDVGSGWGPNNDRLDVEAIVRLSTAPGMAFGFTLRADTNRVAHAAMFDLLRDAFANNWTVRIDYEIANERLRNGRLLRAALVK